MSYAKRAGWTSCQNRSEWKGGFVKAEDSREPSLLNLALASSATQKAVCGISLAKDENPKLARQIDELLGAWPRVQYSTMESTLKKAGIIVRADAISRHSRGKCSCS